VVNLTSGVEVKDLEKHKKGNYGFSITTPDRTWEFYTKSKEAHGSWIKHLSELVAAGGRVCYRSTYVYVLCIYACFLVDLF